MSAGNTTGATQVLAISVSGQLISRWRDWFAPPEQPFRTDLLSPDLRAAIPQRDKEPTAEWRDTYCMYAGTWTWLTEAEFMDLRPGQRRSLLAVRRRTVRPKPVPLWPSELATAGDRLMFDWIATGAVRPSRHRDVPGPVWERAAHRLPRAQQLAGTFPHTGSGPNCLGTVVAATGVADADNRQVAPREFETWLEEHAEPITGTSQDDAPGIVFVWTEHGELTHATVTIGDGWMLTKPSQSWSSPRMIWTVREAVNSWRYPDTRLLRYRLSDGT